MTNFQRNDGKGENPVNQRFTHHWVKTLNNGLVKIESLGDAQTYDCTEAWGARLDTALLTDLSEDELAGLAEHVQTCSACATRLRHYQLIETLAERFTQERFSSTSAKLDETTQRRITKKAEEKYRSLVGNNEKEKRKNILRKQFFHGLHLLQYVVSPFLLHVSWCCLFVQMIKKNKSNHEGRR